MKTLTAPKRVADPDPEFEPGQVDVVELSAPLESLRARTSPDGTSYQRSRVLVRLHGQPLGTLDLALGGCLAADDLRGAIDEHLGEEIAAHLRHDGLESATEPVAEGRGRPRCLGPVVEPAEAPLVSVVVCTYARSEQLASTVASLLVSDYPTFEIVVVDNCPSDPAVRELVESEYGDDARVRYVTEWSRGLSRARNAGYRFSQGDIVAYTDDDVTADKSWISALVSAFLADPEVGCVTGLVLGAQLDTPSQQYFEDFGGFAKGFRRSVYDLGEHRPESPLFPWASGIFGTGANAAFRKSVLGDLWGFDPALGAGTITCGGEDLDCFAELILAGHRLVYEPRALLWHTHVRENWELHLKLRGYSIGFSAYMTKQFVRGSGRRLTMLRAIPAGVGYALRDSRHTQPSREHKGRQFMAAEIRGMARGPWAYLRSRVHNAWLTA